MASIINSISFKNFFNYYGDYPDNSYELKEGLNIIVATNGGGKSKFFNAFLWLFNDQILDSDDKILKSIKDIFVKIISDKAKNETALGDHIECGIKIEYTFGIRYQYQIIKSFSATRIGDNISKQSCWNIAINDVEVYRTDLVIKKYRPIYDEDEKLKIINKLIMPAFRKYSFLQGEEVDKIIDFSQKSSIEEAVQSLTDIKKYEELVALTSYIKDKAEKDLNSQVKSSKDQNERLEVAFEEKRSLINQLENELETLKVHEATFDDAVKEKIELDKNYSNAEKRKELDDKIKETNKVLKRISDEYEEFLEKINNRFFDGSFAWISMGFDDLVNDFKKLNDKFTEERYTKKALLNAEKNPNDYINFLPVDSPDLVSIENMIDNEHCYVCNRSAKEGSHEHNYLIKLKNRPSNSINEKPFVKNDLKEFFGSLQINAQPFYNKIEKIRESVKSTKNTENELKNRLQKLHEKVKSLKSHRKDILVTGIDDNDSAAHIISQYQGAIRRIETARLKIDERLKPKISKLKTDIKNLENEISNYSDVHDVPQGFKDNYSISKDLADATVKAKERVYDDMISLLEEYSNIHFKDLIAKNKIAGGILKFEKSTSGSIDFNYIDSHNNIVPGSSEGFQRMKKFAVVMAIISANTSQYNYPLIADAPLAAFGIAFTEGFLEATAKVFPQSIILVKELYDNNDDMKLSQLGKRLLKDTNVSSMYVNEVTPGVEQIDRITTTIKLK